MPSLHLKHPPSSKSDHCPDAFNHPKRPGTCKPSVQRRCCTGQRKDQHPQARTMFERVRHEHHRDGACAKKRQTIHRGSVARARHGTHRRMLHGSYRLGGLKSAWSHALEQDQQCQDRKRDVRYRDQHSHRGKEDLRLAHLPHHLSSIQHCCDDRNEHHSR
jgi:hypothetical protein